MKILVGIKAIYARMGIEPPRSRRFYQRFNATTWMNVVMVGQFCISSVLHLLIEAHGFAEYVDAIGWTVSLVSHLGDNIVIFCKCPAMFRLIDNFEVSIQESEWYVNLSFCFVLQRHKSKTINRTWCVVRVSLYLFVRICSDSHWLNNNT